MNPTTTRTTPKDFFMHLGATVVLYVAVGALINLSFSIVNYCFPDALASYFYAGSIAWPISMLIVLVPILYILEWLIKRDTKLTPEKEGLWIRRWRIYLTLFLTGAVIAGDLIALINTYLNGEISIRFFYKFLAVLIILGIVFSYYILEKIGKSSKTKTILAYADIVLALVAIVGGFLVVGSPTKQRNIRFDNQRVSDLQNIQYQIVNFWQQKGKLPVNLEDLKDPLYGSVIPADPKTSENYEYMTKSNLSFDLCAIFALPYEITTNKGRFDASYPVIDGINDNWKHEAGRTCFTRTIDPEKYPPITVSPKR
ncbi:MAG TPA: DUF5671 domain-containing protein [Candidatus Paceibacterota bacterium]